MKRTLIESGCPTYDVWPFEDNYDTNAEYRRALVTALTIANLYSLAGFENIAEINGRPVRELFRTSFFSDPQYHLDEETLEKYPIILTIDKAPGCNYYFKIGCFVHHITVASWKYHLELYESSNPYDPFEEHDLYVEWLQNEKVTYSEQFYGYTSRLHHLDGSLIYDGLRFDCILPYWRGQRAMSLAGKYCTYLYEENTTKIFSNGFDITDPTDWQNHERFSLLCEQIIRPETVQKFEDLPTENVKPDTIFNVIKKSDGGEKGYYQWDGSKWNKVEPPENKNFDKHYYLLAFNTENEWNTSPTLLYGTEEEWLSDVTQNTQEAAHRRFLGYDYSRVWTTQFDTMYDANPQRTRFTHSVIGDNFLKDDTVFNAYDARRFNVTSSQPTAISVSGVMGYFYDYTSVMGSYADENAAYPYIGDRSVVPERGFFGMIMPLQLKGIDDDERVVFEDIYFGLTNVSLKDLYESRLIVVDGGIFFYVGGSQAARPNANTYTDRDEPSYPGRHCLFVYLGDIPEEEPDPEQPEPPKEVMKEDVVNLLNNLYDWQLASSLDTLGSISIPDPDWELIKVVGLFDNGQDTLNLQKVLDRADISEQGAYSITGWLEDSEYSFEFNANENSVQLYSSSCINLIRKESDSDLPYLICYNTRNSSGLTYNNYGSVNGENRYFLSCTFHNLFSSYYTYTYYAQGRNHKDLKYVPGDEYRIRVFAAERKNGIWTIENGQYKWCLVDECTIKIPSDPSNLDKMLPYKEGNSDDYIDGGNFIDNIRLTTLMTGEDGYDPNAKYYDVLYINVKRDTITTVDTFRYYDTSTAPFRIEVYKEDEAPVYLGSEKQDALIQWAVYYINPYLIEEEEQP